jgi:hypothetical protein
LRDTVSDTFVAALVTVVIDEPTTTEPGLPLTVELPMASPI